MEIALLPQNGLRLKGKQTTLAVDPQDKATYGGIILVDKNVGQVVNTENVVVIDGPGEYEIGGIKLTGTRSEVGMLYSLAIDNVDVLVGKLSALEKMQHKLKEHNMVVVNCDAEGNASFVTSLAENIVFFYGVKANETAAAFGKENVKQMNKYSSTKEKLSTEVETVVLA